MNAETLAKLHGEVADLNVLQKALTIDTEGKLKDYRLEIDKFTKEFHNLASKKDFAKAASAMNENRAFFDI